MPNTVFATAPTRSKREKQMNDSTTDKIEGTFHEAKGKIKEKVGQVANNPDLEREGKVENLTGKVQKKVGHMEEILESNR
jgi:uncharacterized protein YjbJ (UPF0337 family)